MKTSFCTICCSNYLPKATALAKSIKSFHPNIDVILCLVEKELPENFPLNNHFNKVVLAKDLPLENFDWYIFKYDQLEGSTFVKATLLKYILLSYDKVIYLDPDIYLYSDLNPIVNLDQDIIVTPHQITPCSNLEVIDSSIIGFLLCGIFNLGFIAIKKSDDAINFLNWWEHKLKYYAFLDFNRGLFTDQKWIDIAYTQFNIFCLNKFGYNVANWNINERNLEIEPDGSITVNDTERLAFFHYSSIDSGKDLRIFKLLANEKTLKIVNQLRTNYKDEIRNFNYKEITQTDWSYNYYNNGEKINKLSRLTFFKSKEIRKILINPFNSSNEYILSIGY